MKVHFYSDGRIRVGFSYRNWQRLITHYQTKGALNNVPVMQSGDAFRDDEPVAGILAVGVSAEPTTFTTFGSGSTYSSSFTLQIHDLLLLALAEQLAAGTTIEEPLAENVTLYVEPDELHYADREAGMAANLPVR